MINSTVTTISPKRAEQILKLNKTNRPMNGRHVDFLANEILSGNWKLNGESIKIGKDTLIDGQHRLRAIIQSGRAIKTLLLTGVDNETFDTIDTGKLRSGGDVLSILGEKHVNNLSALLILIKRYYKQKNFSGRYKASNIEIEKLLQEYPDARDFAGISPRCTGLIPPRVIEFCHYVTSKIDNDESDKFIHGLCTGNSLTARNPILVLRNKIMQSRLGGAKYSADAMIGMILKTWNLVRDGKKISRLAFKPGELVPKAK